MTRVDPSATRTRCGGSVPLPGKGTGLPRDTPGYTRALP